MTTQAIHSVILMDWIRSAEEGGAVAPGPVRHGLGPAGGGAGRRRLLAQHHDCHPSLRAVLRDEGRRVGGADSGVSLTEITASGTRREICREPAHRTRDPSEAAGHRHTPGFTQRESFADRGHGGSHANPYGK